MGIDIEKVQPQPNTNCAHGYDVMRIYIYLYMREQKRNENGEKSGCDDVRKITVVWAPVVQRNRGHWTFASQQLLIPIMSGKLFCAKSLENTLKYNYFAFAFRLNVSFFYILSILDASLIGFRKLHGKYFFQTLSKLQVKQ